MNTKCLVKASIFALISASTAQAADVMIPNQPAPTVSPSAVVVPTFTWAGFYLGAQAGGFSSKVDMNIIDGDTTVPLNKDLLPKLSGFVGGLYAGSNVDLGDNFFLGIDTDFIWSGKKHTKTVILDTSHNSEIENVIGRTRRSAAPAAAAPAAALAPAAAPAKPPATVAGHGAGSHGVNGAGYNYHSYGGGSNGGVSHGGGSNGGGSNGGGSNGGGSNGGGSHAHPHSAGSPSPHPHGASHGAGRAMQNAQNADNRGDSSYGVEQIRSMVLSFGLAQENRVKDLSHTLKQNWAGTTRVRIGFAADRIMPYVAGGIAYTQLQDTVSLSFQESEGKVLSSKNLADETKTMVGYTLGGGIDFAVVDNVILRAEYRYSDFGKKKFAKEKLEINYKTNDFRVGVAYKF
ncbi:outer membrane protein [Bartonella sp. CB175]|uniref:outer membrane protein n=1 Tax=Bartonella sp. CB175 TaxID=3112256 RepID=UPI00300E5E22